jgi:hypothetical protein
MAEADARRSIESTDHIAESKEFFARLRLDELDAT